MASVAQIPGFAGYRVNSDGQVETCISRGGSTRALTAQWRPKVARPDKDGYPAVTLYRDGRGYGRRVHRLVLEAFVGPCPPGMEGCHNNGVPADCRLENLRWDTPAGNQHDRIAHGTAPRGSGSGLARLSEQTVDLIRARLAAGEEQAALAAEYGVAASTISAIHCGRSWQWLTGEDAAASHPRRAPSPRFGETNHATKLTAEQVAEIRRRAACGETQRALASVFGVSQPQIGNIVRHKHWSQPAAP